MNHHRRLAMRFVYVLMLGLSITLATGAVAATKDGWPDTRPGAIGRAWVAAFAAGDSAMRQFYFQYLSKESLAQKSIDERLVTYRASRERFGKLTFASVDKSTPEELTVTLLDADLKSVRHVFKVQNVPPWKLVSISRLENRHGFGFHH
jgi:hypothetical protein